jgi:hypothetical protein
MLFRLLISLNNDNFTFLFQATNQYSYFLFGCIIFYIFKNRITNNFNIFINVLFFISFLVNFLAFLQYFFPESSIVLYLLKIYGGKSDLDIENQLSSSGYFGYSSMAALSVLLGKRAVSIFNGMQGLATFNLVIISISIGFLKSEKNLKKTIVGILTLLFSIIGGFLSASKTFIFGLVLFIIIYSFIKITFRKIINFFIYFLLFSSLLIILSNENQVIKDIYSIFKSANFSNIFSSRFSSDTGYLSDVNEILYSPVTFLLGQGSNAGKYKYADFEYRQIYLIGGVFFFLVYYSFLLYIIFTNWNSRNKNSYSLSLFSINISLLFCAIGMDVHLQGRVMPLWILLNLLLSTYVEKK